MQRIIFISNIGCRGRKRGRKKIADRGHKAQWEDHVGIYEYNVPSSRGVVRAENIAIFCRSVKVQRR